MTLSDATALLLAWLAGIMIGLVFFGGLAWTVRKGISAQQPALWFMGSLLIRMGLALAGFYFVANGHWNKLLLCLVGFIMARLIVIWHTRPQVRRHAA